MSYFQQLLHELSGKGGGKRQALSCVSGGNLDLHTRCEAHSREAVRTPGSWWGSGPHRPWGGCVTGATELSDCWCGNGTTRQSAALAAADSALGPGSGEAVVALVKAGHPQPWGDSQDEGAGFLEPTEGLEKPTGVLTLPGQSFDGLDDLVMQIAEWGVGGTVIERRPS